MCRQKFSRLVLCCCVQTDCYLYSVCLVLVVADLALALAQMEWGAACIQVVEVHHSLVAVPLVLLLVPSSFPAAHPSSYLEAAGPLHLAQMDKTFVQRQDALEGALAWDHRDPSSLAESDRGASCQVVAEAFLGPSG